MVVGNGYATESNLARRMHSLFRPQGDVQAKQQRLRLPEYPKFTEPHGRTLDQPEDSRWQLLLPACPSVAGKTSTLE